MKSEYGIDIMSNLPKKKYEAIILAVAHEQFKDIDFFDLKKDLGVIYDVKGILPRNIIDGRL